MTWAGQLYGLTIDSDRPLYVDALPAAPGQSADVVIRHSTRAIPSQGPMGGEILLHFEYDETHYFCERRDDGSFRLVFADACEFEITSDLRHVTVYRHAGATEGIEGVLAAGAQMAWQIYMRGELVLHASCVQLGERAVAFVAPSGRGKSTMATLMCAAGGRIVTDDLLRVEFADGLPVARLGSSELRLRKGADVLSAGFEGTGPVRRSSADERQVLRPVERADDYVPLAAIFMPVPEHERREVRVDRIVSADAMFAVLRSPRLLGWKDNGVQARQFSLTAALLAKVPLSFAYVPWGPPFDPAITSALISEIDNARLGRRLDITA